MGSGHKRVNLSNGIQFEINREKHTSVTKKKYIWKKVSGSLYAEPAGFLTWATMCCLTEWQSPEWL